MGTFLWGEEDFLLWKNLISRKENFLKKNSNAPVDTVDFEEDFNLKETVSKLHQGGGLFAQKKLFIVKNIFSISEDQQEGFLKILASFNPENNKETEIILIQNGSITKYKKTGLYKYLIKNFKTEEFKKLKPVEIKKFILEEIFEKSGGKNSIEPSALEELQSISQGNLWFLANEIEKLINHAEQGKKIKKTDIDEISYGKAESKIFDLVDAIGRRDKKRALQLVSALLFQGENAFYIFTMMIYQIRNLAKIFSFQDQDSNLLSKKLGMHPFVIKKTQAQLKSFSGDEIKRAYAVAAQLDFDMKKGNSDAENSLYDFILKI